MSADRRPAMSARCETCDGTGEVLSPGCDCPSACTEDCPVCRPEPIAPPARGREKGVTQKASEDTRPQPEAEEPPEQPLNAPQGIEEPPKALEVSDEALLRECLAVIRKTQKLWNVGFGDLPERLEARLGL